MKAGKAFIASAVAAVALLAVPQVAAADPVGCPPGHFKKGWCGGGDRSHYTRRHDGDGYRYDGDRYYEREDALDDAYEEGYRDGRADALRIGTRLSRDRYRILDRDLYYDRYGRRLDDRYYYADVDGRRLLIEAATGTILDLLSR